MNTKLLYNLPCDLLPCYLAKFKCSTDVNFIAKLFDDSQVAESLIYNNYSTKMPCSQIHVSADN